MHTHNLLSDHHELTYQDGLFQFHEFVGLVARFKRYRSSQLMGMKGCRQAISSDMPHNFKIRGASVLDPALGHAAPVRYTADPRYRVRSPKVLATCANRFSASDSPQ